jgi:ribonuclease P protein component
MVKIITIKKRAVFEAARAKGTAVSTAGFIVQALEIHEQSGFTVGYTVSKRVGNAVVRNRVKRRLRALVQKLLPERAKGGVAYVFIGKKAAFDRPFERLEADFKYAFHQLVKGV